MAWLADWDNRLEFTIDNARVGQDLTDFPTLITLASGVGRNGFDATHIFDELNTPSGSSLLYYEDFSSPASANDWTLLAGAGDIYDFTEGYMRNNNNSTTFSTAVSDAAYEAADFDVKLKMVQGSSGASKTDTFIYFFYPYQPDFPSPYLYMSLRAYYSGDTYDHFSFYIRNAQGVTLYALVLHKWDYSANLGTWFWGRIKRTGDNFYFKHWKDGDTEPASWDDTAVIPDLGAFEGSIYAYSRTGNYTGYDEITISGATISSNNNKIAMTDYTGVNQLPVEIENWDQYKKRAYLWTKVPTVVSGTDTTIYLYYDKDQLDNDLNVGDIGSTPGKSVWDSNFVFVSHQAQSPAGSAPQIKDSTINVAEGTTYWC